MEPPSSTTTLAPYGERLRENGQGDLRRGAGADVQAGGAVDPVEILDPAADQPVGARVLEATRTDRADVADGSGERGLEGCPGEPVVVADHDEVVQRGK